MPTNADDREEALRLFRAEIPEMAGGVVEIKALARIRGHRCILLVASADPQIDPVGACAGKQGLHVKNLRPHLTGETIHICRADSSTEEIIRNLLAPRVVVESIVLNASRKTAEVRLKYEFLAAADGENLPLLCEITGWEIRLIPV